MDKLGVCTSRHVRTVSLVVSAVDDFTDRVITGSNARVWIEGAKPPIRKAEGWHVFVDLPAGEHTVYAEGGFYNRNACICKIEPGSCPNIKIRLTPGRNAPLASDTACIEGTCAPHARIFVRADDRALSYKLLADAKRGESRIGIYHPDGIDIEGKLFCICSGEEEEFVRVYRASPEGRSEYLLAAPLTQDHAKIGTLIYPLSESCADERGMFFVPLKNVPARETAFLCRRDTPDGGGCTITLSAGSRVKAEI